jgi:hypothetical protein
VGFLHITPHPTPRFLVVLRHKQYGTPTQGRVLGDRSYDGSSPTIYWGGCFPSNWPTSTYPPRLYVLMDCMESDTPIDNKDLIPLFLFVHILFASLIASCVRLVRLCSRFATSDWTRRQQLWNIISRVIPSHHGLGRKH